MPKRFSGVQVGDQVRLQLRVGVAVGDEGGDRLYLGDLLRLAGQILSAAEQFE